MRESDFKSAVDAVSKAIDGAGVVVVVIGLLVATGGFVVEFLAATSRSATRRFQAAGPSHL